MMRLDNFRMEIPGVNTDNGLKLCSGKKELYIQSLRLFVTNIPATLAKMRNVKESNLKDYALNAHSLKSMCVYIGAEEIRMAAKHLEETADSGDYKGVLEGNSSLIEQTEKIITDIKTWLDKNKDMISKIQNQGKSDG